MVTTNPVINELKTLLSRKKAEEHEVRQRLQRMLDEIQADVQAIERTLNLYLEDKPTGQETETNANVSVSHLRKLGTQMKALDHIADKNEGRVKLTVAKQLLIEAGLVTGNPKYAYGHIRRVLQDSGRYDKSGVGEFIRTQNPLPLTLNGQEANDNGDSEAQLVSLELGSHGYRTAIN